MKKARELAAETTEDVAIVYERETYSAKLNSKANQANVVAIVLGEAYGKKHRKEAVESVDDLLS